jgi:hypothetical protein
MTHSLSRLILLYAQQFEDQHAPQNMTIALREAAKELDRLQAGGCARDQSTTQYCAEAAAKDAEIARLKEEVERLRAALEWYADAANHKRRSYPDEDRFYPALIEYDAGEKARAALTPSRKPRT